MSFSKIFQNDLKTIFAPSTALSFSAIAVFRISGPLAKKAFEILKTNINLEKIQPRKAYFTKIFDEDYKILDSCIIIFFESPKSFTGEDLVEIQTHGSPLITKILCEIFSKQPNFAHAEQGEFSRRALQNKKMDLVQAEGLLKLIHSQTKKQLYVAHKELDGEISQIFENLREKIIENLSFTEALIDFPEDDLDDSFDDMPENQNKRKISQIELQIKQNLANLGNEIKKFLSDGEINQKIIDGFEILIIGKPNSGKSSLLNYISGEDLAIVSELPGTTRDLLEKRLDLDGYLVKLIDSAGIRDLDVVQNQSFSESEKAHIEIEKLGIEKAFKISSKAHLLLILIDSFDFDAKNFSDQKVFEEKYNFLKKNEIFEKIQAERALFVLTKMDDEQCEETKIFSFFDLENQKLIPVSSKNKKGLGLLKREILKKISEFLPESDPVIGSKRQRLILNDAYNLIDYIVQNFENFEYLEILAEEIRKLAVLTASLTETISNDEILDSLFSKFCIGK